MTPPLQHLLITGGAGYIGSRLVKLARARDLPVTLLGRSYCEQARKDPGIRHFFWSMEQPLPEAAFEVNENFPPVSAVVHLAHIWDPSPELDPDPNQAGLEQLLTVVRNMGELRFVF